MERTLPAPLSLQWRWLGWSLYIGVNLALVLTVRPDLDTPDWQLWFAVRAAENPYVTDTPAPFVWSPLMVPVMVGATMIGYWAWGVLHVAAVLLLRDWRLIGLVLASWGFWVDTAVGNTFVFAFVAGALALRGSKWGAVAYMTLLFLVPRPVQVPVALWLLWKMPEIRWPTAAVFAVHAALVLASGYADEWAAALTMMAGPIEGPPVNAGNLAPSALIGSAWWPIGFVIGCVLLWRQRLGLASLAWSPYWLPAYLLVLLWEVIPRRAEAPPR